MFISFEYQRGGVQLSNDSVTAAESGPGTSSTGNIILKMFGIHVHITAYVWAWSISGFQYYVLELSISKWTSTVCQLFVRISSSHPTFSMSGRRGFVTRVCQLVYLILDICGGAVKVEVVETTGAMVAFRLLTNMGSKQATLAAKNAWMQWRTAKRLENSSSWKNQGGKLSWSFAGKKEAVSSRNQIKLGAWKCLYFWPTGGK